MASEASIIEPLWYHSQVSPVPEALQLRLKVAPYRTLLVTKEMLFVTSNTGAP